MGKEERKRVRVSGRIEPHVEIRTSSTCAAPRTLQKLASCMTLYDSTGRWGFTVEGSGKTVGYRKVARHGEQHSTLNFNAEIGSLGGRG